MSQTLADEYMDWYNLGIKTLESELLNPLRPGDIEGIALSGMGGSGIVCDVAYILLKEKLDLPVTVVKGFKLPSWVKRKWAVFTVSYSGMTLETLSVAHEALKKGAYLYGVTSGGELLRLCTSKSLTCQRIEPGRAPRTSFPALLIGLIKLLNVAGLYENLKDVKNSLNKLKDIEIINPHTEELTSFLEGTIPVLVTNEDHYPLALRGKDELNENSKMPAFTQIYPESAHNDIVAWEAWYGPISAVVLDPGDEILKYIASYMSAKGVPVKVVDLKGFNNFLSRMLWWALVIGLTSLRLAWRRGINPSETESIKKYKEFLRQKPPRA